jgi:hypothetical protein
MIFVTVSFHPRIKCAAFQSCATAVENRCHGTDLNVGLAGDSL